MTTLADNISGDRHLPLDGLRVVDAASLYAGPLVATMLGDFGADVIKIEHPRGDGMRNWGWDKDGESVWWTFVGRNKKSVTLKLSDPRGADLMRQLVDTADVLVENFRPGTLEKWGLDPQELIKANPKLIVVRVTGFGQTGPYSQRPGFGTLAEAMSGFAHTNGPEGGPPMLPKWPLADGVAGIMGAYATMVALRERDRRGSGQVVDLSLYEPIFWMLGAQTSAYDQLGHVPVRSGNHAPNTVPRNCYQASDGRWLAISGNAVTIAVRIMHSIGRADLAEQPWFSDLQGRIAHQDEIDDAIASWIGQRTSDVVIAAFEAAQAAIGPVYTIADAVDDPHFRQRNTVTAVPHPRWGQVLMQGVVPKLTETPGDIRWTGPQLGQHNVEIIIDELGCTAEDFTKLIGDGVVCDGRTEN